MSAAPGALLAERRFLVTGVVTTESIAWAVAAQAQRMGAEVVLTGFERDMARTRDAAARLPGPVEVLELDATSPEDHRRLVAELRRSGGVLHGAVHAVAHAPRRALDGDMASATAEDLCRAMTTSVHSYSSLGSVLAELAPDEGGSLVGLDFDAARAWPTYNWMGVCKSALESLNRYLARDLGVRGIRANLVAAGPLHTRAASGIPGFGALLESWERSAPLRWDPCDAGPAADAVCFLLSPLARAVTGEVLHVDGGHHAMAAPLR